MFYIEEKCVQWNRTEQGDIHVGEKEISLHCRPAEAIVRIWFHTAPGRKCSL